jgi:hypothetical protein
LVLFVDWEGGYVFCFLVVVFLGGLWGWLVDELGLRVWGLVDGGRASARRGNWSWKLRGWLLTVLVELSLTVPIVNTLAFLFTVVGEWWVEGKVISRGTFWLLFCREMWC